MLAGKYLNSWETCGPRPEFDRWACVGAPEPSTYSLLNPWINEDGEWQRRNGYQPDILADDVVEFVESTPDDQPFFAMYSPTTPHLPADDPRYDSMSVSPPHGPSFDQDTLTARSPLYARRGPLIERRDRRRRLAFRQDVARGALARRWRRTHPGRPRRPHARHDRDLPLRQRVPLRRASPLRQDRRLRGVRPGADDRALPRPPRPRGGVHVSGARLQHRHRTVTRRAGGIRLERRRTIVHPPPRPIRAQHPISRPDRALPGGEQGHASVFRHLVLRPSDASRSVPGSRDVPVQVRAVRRRRSRALRSPGRSARVAQPHRQTRARLDARRPPVEARIARSRRRRHHDRDRPLARPRVARRERRRSRSSHPRGSRRTGAG